MRLRTLLSRRHTPPSGRLAVDAAVRCTVETLEGRTLMYGAADVFDALGNVVGEILPIAALDTTGPQTSIGAVGGIDRADDDPLEVRVTYTDILNGVNLGTVDVADLSITGPGGVQLAVTGLDVNSSNGGDEVVAKYDVAAPGGSWDSADNGTYTVSVRAGAVADLLGNLSEASASRTFTVNIAAPKPAIDDGFGGGVVSNDFIAESSTTQADGKILVVGRRGSLADGTSQYVIKRLNADGSPDGSFGSGGSVESPAGGNDAAFAVATDALGNIYVAGAKGTDLAVTKIKKNGSVDGKFGDKGQAVVDLGGADVAYSVAVAADGSVVAGGGSSGKFALVKLTSTGALDGTFAGSGRVLLNLGNGNVVGGVAVQEDGKIVAAGSAGENVAVVRVTTFGTLDATFGQFGTAGVNQLASRADIGSGDHTVGVALQADGRILVANRTAGGDFGVVRLSSGGDIDGSFGNAGLATIDFGGDDDADAVLVQGSGEIFAVGTTNAGGKAATGVAALNDNGTLAADFGTGGKFVTDVALDSQRALHMGDVILRAFGNIQPNGQLLVGSSNLLPSPRTNSGLRRLNVPGSGLLGRFGNVSGRNRTLAFTDADGTVAIIRLIGGGTGTASYQGGFVDIVLTGASPDTIVQVRSGGGDGRLNLRDLRSDSGIKALFAPMADISGTVFIDGDLGKALLGSVTASGKLATSGSMGNIQFGGDIAGQVLAGVDLGGDAKSGGGDDTYNAASIITLKTRGRFAGALVAAGVDAGGDDDFLSGSNQALGGSIAKLVAKDADSSTTFLAAAFGKANLGGLVDIGTDGRFQVV